MTCWPGSGRPGTAVFTWSDTHSLGPPRLVDRLGDPIPSFGRWGWGCVSHRESRTRTHLGSDRYGSWSHPTFTVTRDIVTVLFESTQVSSDIQTHLLPRYLLTSPITGLLE